VRASVVTTLVLLVVASLPGVVRAASTEGGFRIEGYPHLAAVPSGARVLVDDNGNTTSYAYDARDRGTYVVGADLTVQRSVYDLDSNVVETIDRNGTTIAYTHDGDHRVVKAEVTRRATNLEGTGQGVEGTGVMAWEYDGLSRPRVCVDQNDPSDPADDVATSYTFDSLSRPLTERHRFRASTTVNSVFTQFGRIGVGSAGIDKTIAHTFDLDSNRTSTTYSSGRTISYGLDGADRIQQIVEGALGAGPAIQTTEWLGGRPLRSDAGNGVRTQYGYDADRRLTSLAHVGNLGAGANVTSFGYAWTRGNQRASETFSAAGLPSATQTYSYDSASRLVRVAFAGGAAARPDTTWLIDGVGNQVKKEEDGVATALNVRANGRYLPDLMNEVATFSRFDATAAFLGEERHVQDPNGSRIKDGQFNLYFDAFERLVRVERTSDGVVVGRYRYDAAGRRVDRQFRVGAGPLQQVFHVHDGAQEVEEIDGSGAVQADFVWGGLYVDQLVQMRRGGATYYAYANSVFSVVALTDASGAVAERYGYSSVYGVCQVQNADGSSRSLASEVGNQWRFQGRRFDPETGWLYFRARFLDPVAGRWVSRDPLGIWGDAGQIGNAYSFCGNDPVNGVDPSGLNGIATMQGDRAAPTQPTELPNSQGTNNTNRTINIRVTPRTAPPTTTTSTAPGTFATLSTGEGLLIASIPVMVVANMFVWAEAFYAGQTVENLTAGIAIEAQSQLIYDQMIAAAGGAAEPGAPSDTPSQPPAQQPDPEPAPGPALGIATSAAILLLVGEEILNGKDVVVGLDRFRKKGVMGPKGELAKFASHVHAVTGVAAHPYMRWEREGLVDPCLPKVPLGPWLAQGLSRARHIHFNLTGMKDKDLSRAIDRGRADGPVEGNITNWELSHIIDSGMLGKTTFWRDGEIADPPAAVTR